MILRNLNIDRCNLARYEVTTQCPLNWNSYYNQYQNVLCFLVNQNLNIDARFMSLLFIFRHTVELFLKKKISLVETTHSLKKLYESTTGLPDDFIEKLEVLDCDGESESFKYVSDKQGNRYFNATDILFILNPLRYFYHLVGINNKIVDKPKGKFEIHPFNLRTLGQVRTDYDFSIDLIIEGINKNELQMNDVYLPLLFLIRHSMELGLKSNLTEAKEYLLPNKLSIIQNEHSICRLFNLLNGIIDKALMEIGQSGFREKTKSDHDLLQQLSKEIHKLDSNSYYFRFPYTTDGTPFQFRVEKSGIYKMLNLCQEVDAYLTFAISVLQYYGYIGTSSNEM